MSKIRKAILSIIIVAMLSVAAWAQTKPIIEPNWESLAEHYQVPQWFVDGKIGVWFHWGISSAADENRPNDGSHYGRRMYSIVPDLSLIHI